MQATILTGRQVVKYDTNINITCHGNSLVFGQSGATVPSGAYPYQLQRMAPINNQITITNHGYNGITWAMMFTAGAPGVQGAGALTDATYVPGKINILLPWEGHNALRAGRGPQGAFDDAMQYSSERLGVHPGWYMLHMTCLPAYYQSWTDSQAAAFNADLEEYNRLLRNNWRSTGAKGLIDLRAPGSFFNLPNYNKTTFQALAISGQSVWSPNDAEGGAPTPGQNQWVHPGDIGYTWVANRVADVLRRLPVR